MHILTIYLKIFKTVSSRFLTILSMFLKIESMILMMSLRKMISIMINLPVCIKHVILSYGQVLTFSLSSLAFSISSSSFSLICSLFFSLLKVSSLSFSTLAEIGSELNNESSIFIFLPNNLTCTDSFCNVSIQ
uniref:Uncharacterized protein n=1 Tax=Cacopsylla melanoneura TaxID=428564 RepID=A0A8D9AUB1_9HEMI